MSIADPRDRAREAGLRHVDPDTLPLTRRRRGKGFQYLNGGGETVEDEALKRRLNALAVPPAWTEVRLARDPVAHIQAVGRDAEGRRQYRYHDLWTESGAAVKAARLRALGAGLGELREEIGAQMRRRTVDRDFAMACAVALLDRAGLRVGYAEYCRETGGRGAMTLQGRHARIEGRTVELAFYGKSGKRIRRRIEDAELATALARLKQARGATLLSWGRGEDATLTAEDVNAFLHGRIGEEISARDFRTFRASTIVAGALREVSPDQSDSARTRSLRAAICEAAEFLANTQAVCRTSYVHPVAQSAFLDSALDPGALFRGPLRTGLARDETALMRLLD